jgi:hypothetical protein
MNYCGSATQRGARRGGTPLRGGVRKAVFRFPRIWFSPPAGAPTSPMQLSFGSRGGWKKVLAESSRRQFFGLTAEAQDYGNIGYEICALE